MSDDFRPMTPDDLQAIRQRCDDEDVRVNVEWIGNLAARHKFAKLEEASSLILTDIPALLAEVERLQAKVALADELVEKLVGYDLEDLRLTSAETISAKITAYLDSGKGE